MKNDGASMNQSSAPESKEPRKEPHEILKLGWKFKVAEASMAAIGILYIIVVLFLPILFGYMFFTSITSESSTAFQILLVTVLFLLSLALLFYIVVLVIVPICRWMREERQNSRNSNSQNGDFQNDDSQDDNE